jgi:hypothetical protein
VKLHRKKCLTTPSSSGLVKRVVHRSRKKQKSEFVVMGAAEDRGESLTRAAAPAAQQRRACIAFTDFIVAIISIHVLSNPDVGYLSTIFVAGSVLIVLYLQCLAEECGIYE